jgi:hypothetical protein
MKYCWGSMSTNLYKKQKNKNMRELLFTPLRILNAKSNRSMRLITARKAGVLNVQWCKKP